MNPTPRRFNSLRQFVRDGLWSSVCDGIAESNFSPYAVAIEASASEAGFLSGLTQLLGSWMQLWCERLIVLFGSRKRLVLYGVWVQCVLLATIIAATIRGWNLYAFIALAVAYGASGSLTGPAWNAWVSDLLPARRRGVCFSIRNQRTSPASFLALVAGGILLDRFGGHFSTRAAFCAVFGLGLAAKLGSLKNLWQQQEFDFDPSQHSSSGPMALLSEASRDGEIRRIVVFFGAMAFAVNLSAPFQAHYMLKSLGLSYLDYTLLLGLTAVARFLAAPVFGRIVDHIGSRRLLTYSAALMPILPLGWSLAHAYAVLAVLHFLTGVIWAAYDLCSFTYIAESLTPARRPRAFATRQATSNLMAFSGAALGGTLLHVGLPFTHAALGTGIVFWAGFFGRAAAALTVFLLPLELASAPQPEALVVEPLEDTPEAA